ncbi:MAG: TonB-dependent receptor [Myxococcota bacterium]
MPFLERVELSAALRYSGFDGSFDNLSYHAGAVWSPLPGLTLRATAASAFRAPSIRDLFLGPQDDFPSIADPCALRVGRLESPLVAANCEADGLGAGVQDDRTQLRQQRVGNPNLEPETAETFGLGLVLEDLPLRGLRLTLDYYDHVISDGIRVLEAREILSACYDRDFRGFCDNVVRSSAGTIDSVLTPTVNASLVSARGLDASLRYQSPETAAGRFGLGLDGTLALDLDFGSGSVVDSYSSGVQAAYRIQAFVDWAWRFLGANLQLRYLPGIDECPGGCLNTSQFRRVSDYLQLDLQLSAAFVTPLGTTRFSGGLLNLSDTEPPFVAVAFGPASDRRNYDFVGRQFYLRITQAF